MNVCYWVTTNETLMFHMGMYGLHIRQIAELSVQREDLRDYLAPWAWALTNL